MKYIFTHIPKTAGSTLKIHFQKNLQGKEVEIGYTELGISPSDYNTKDIKESAQKYLKTKNLRTIKIVYGHAVPYGIDKAVAPARYITFVREPTRRAISTYNYLRTRYDQEVEAKRLAKPFRDSLLIKKEVPEFEEWFEKKFNKVLWALPAFSMARYLQIMGYLEKGKFTPKKVDSLFKKFHFVGTTETFAIDSLYLYKELSINKFFINRNTSRRFIDMESYKRYVPMVKKKIPEDYEIFARGVYENQKFKSSNSFFKTKKYRSLYLQKKLTTPFTQLIYDPRNNIYLTLLGAEKVLPFGKDKIRKLAKSVLTDQ